MKIIKAEAIAVSIPLLKPFKIAVGVLKNSTQVLVKLTDDQGLTGWGESSTFLEVYGYDQASLYRALNDYLLPGIIGLDPRQSENIHFVMDKIMPHNLMAKAAVDLACLDLCGQAAGQPLHVMIGGKRMDKIPMTGAVDMVDPDQAGDFARELLAQGFKHIKVKIGQDAVQDVERVKNVHAVLPKGVKLRVDGNAGYSRSQARDVFSRLDDLGMEWIEQPLPAWDLKGHAELAKILNTPIALDESVYTPQEARNCLEQGAGSVVNVKIVKCGGIRRSQKIVSLCHASGVPCFLGGNLDLSLSMAGAAQFYSATTGVVSGAEMLGSVMVYEDDVVKEPLTVKDGFLEVPDKPGLGVEIDEKKLAKHRIDL
jgi:muconate cycloisomerase